MAPKHIYPITKQCSVCGTEYTPKPTMRKLQLTCGSAECKREQYRRTRFSKPCARCGSTGHETKSCVDEATVKRIRKAREDGETKESLMVRFKIGPTILARVLG